MQELSNENNVHLVKRVASVVVTIIIMLALRYSTLITESDPSVFSVTLLGLMLVLSFNIGKLLSRLNLPTLSIYLITGILCGPFVLGFLSSSTIDNLKFIDTLALGLIAFIAGGELRLKELLRMKKVLVSISLMETLMVFIFCAVGFIVLTPLMPFTQSQTFLLNSLIALIMAALLVANSPAVTIGIIGEYKSKGLLTETILGSVIFKDIIVIVLFATVTTFVMISLDSTAEWSMMVFIKTIGYEIGMSIVAGLGVGFLVYLYIRFIGEQPVLFVIGAAFMSYEIARQFHLEVLLVGVSAGFAVQNFTKQGEALVEHVEESLPIVYPIFFAIAGAKINLPLMLEMWYLALFLAVIRTLGIYFGVRKGARMASAAESVQKYAWMGFVSQAGVALGLATIVNYKFPEWGGYLQTILLSVIGINQLVGPILLQKALDKAGEINKPMPQGSILN
ncbi:MAG TPA: cation:proton antiporter [bacterium]|nr:cation:proton antiporter [bacterium]HMW32896.1 cation:proton antiporter [bacterium]HMW35185.1 cation:proton antiporter [bacterium]HMY36689.1 cation:proton antiporter [bacterium]HMZ03850.1 cation:proton antiporter [bacterium]